MSHLLVENGPRKGERFELPEGKEIAIGRDQSLELCLPDPLISRRHLTIAAQGGSARLKDLGSANGTAVNGERVAERRLTPGDRILVGETLLTYLEGGEPDPLTGKTLKGHEILKRIGRGGMGTVYLARQTSLERPVAIKILSPELVEDPLFIARFQEEARSAARLNHPNLVMVYDIDEAVIDGRRIVYYSMEYMSGGSVEEALHRGGKMDPEGALRCALDTAKGLQYAEQVGIVHRDIKPGNLMIHESGAVKIGDLGIAARTRKGGSTAAQKGKVSGSPHYISPEQARGQDLDSRADIYSLGASLFQLLAGRTPFSGGNVREVLLQQIHEPAPDLRSLRPEVPAPVAELVARMLEKSREKRPAGAGALIASIEAALIALRTSGPEAAGPTRSGFRISRRTLNLASFAVIFASLVWVAARSWAAVRDRREARRRREAAHQAILDRAEEALRVEKPGPAALERTDAELVKLADDPWVEGEFPAIHQRARELLERVASARAAADERGRWEEAERKLDAILAAAPPLDGAKRPQDLQDLLPPLVELAREEAGSPAAARAGGEIARIRSAIRSLEERFERGGDAWRSLRIASETLLEAEPPRFREALEKLRDPPKEILETPSAPEVARRLAEITRQMEETAQKWVKEARDQAATGKKEEALRRLERLRERIEGKSRAALEAAMAEISGAQ